MDRTQRVKRRHFLRSSGRAIAGLAGLLAGQPPAAWAARELSLLTAVNYAPTSDVKLAELGKRFAKLAGASVRIHHIQSVQMSAKLSSQLMSRSGHDIISLEMHYPWLFAPALADVSDICNDLSRKHGEWYSFAREHAYIKGQWLGVPYLFISFPGSHRIDLFEKVGERAPDTWEDLLRAGRKLKKLGHPVGIAISQTTGFHPSPAGPAGRHTVGVPRSLGIWKFSKNVDLAKDYLRWFFEPAQYHEWIMSGDNYNHPVWRDMENHAVWNVDAKYEPLKTIAQYCHLYGWPAPPDERIQLVTNSYVIPNMFAKVVTNGAKPKEAILWAETEIQRMLE